MKNQCHLGINFSERFFQIAELERQNGKYFIKCLDEIENKLEYNPEEMADLIYRPDFIYEVISNLKEILSRNNITSRNASLALDSNSFYINVFPVDPALNDIEIQEHLQWEISVIFPFSSPDSFHIISSVLTETGTSKELLVVVIRKDVVKFFKEIFKKLELKMSLFEVDHFAAISSYFFNYPELSIDEINLMKMNDSIFEICTIDSGKVNKFIKIRLEEKSQLKTRLQGIYNNGSQNRLYLFGREVDDPSNKNNKRNILGMDFEICNPFRKLEISPELPRRQEFMLNRSSFAAPVGLALRKIK
jgi:Tfp pilus assembly PilM family ATPase